MRRYLTQLVLLVVLAVAGVPVGSVNATHQVAELGAGVSPRTDGKTIVWPGDRDLSRIYAADVATMQPVVVVDRAEVASAYPLHFGMPDVDDGVVVWLEQRREGWPDWISRIRGKRLSTGEIFEVTQEPRVMSPRISGEFVVWTQDDGIWIRNISTMTEPMELARIQLEAAPKEYPPGIQRLAFEGDVVAWLESGRAGSEPGVFTWAVRFVRLGDAQPTTLATGISEPYRLKVDSVAISGDLVAYNASSGIQVENIVTGKQRLVPISEAANEVQLDGRFVFWDDFELFGPPNVMLGYDLETGATFEVANDGGSNYVSHASNGWFLWTDRTYTSEVRAIRIADALPSGPVSPPTEPDASRTYFPETGHQLIYGMKNFWENNGGLPVFGYPLTEEFTLPNPDTGDRLTTQYFERQRLEWHPENAGTPYEVLLGRLGAELLALQGRNWMTEPKADPATAHYYPQTGQAIAPEFWAYWSGHGLDLGDAGVSARESLALFGYPLTPAKVETNADGHTVLTQYFERAVFEYHPGNPDPYKVMLRRAGAEVLATYDW